jgi:RNA polymerase subunit RPABC4/transcription elongation factor Spt4
MDLLDRLYRRLLAAAGSGDPESRRATIADLYQRLIPYRAIRGEVGVMELAEYEHALLRLLAGERRYVELGDPTAILEIQRELSSLNPILGIYRDYPNVEVRITTGGGDVDMARPPLGEAATAAASVASIGSRERSSPTLPEVGADRLPPDIQLRSAQPAAKSRPLPMTALRPPAATAKTPDRVARPDSPDHAAPVSRACHGCKRPLPDRPDAMYCPFCGAAQGPVPCRSCGAALESSWRFCARCGANRSTAPAV